jgi:two-component system alkaline phosphatase synthesis response regulator PhoP
MKVVYIGGDGRTSEIATLAIHLRWPDVTTQNTTSAREGIDAVERIQPDVVLLHPDFEDLPLDTAIREIRRLSQAPLLVLGRDGDEMEVITSLELGADEYIRLPCDLTEIMVRIWALLRRTGVRPFPRSEGSFSSGRLFINPANYEVFLGNQRIYLTFTEFRLLHLLIKNRGTVVTHRTLERALWGEHVESSRLVKKYVQRLRQKLEDDAREPCWVGSVHGVGYRFIGPLPDVSEAGELRYAHQGH